MSSFRSDPVFFAIDFQSEERINESDASEKKDFKEISYKNSDSGYEQSETRTRGIPETLNFKRYWNRNWRKANAEAAKMVEQMLHNNDQGLIVIVYNTPEWKGINDTSSLPSSFITLVNNNKSERKQFDKYWMYVIKSNSVILDNVNIDGNMYAINCEIQFNENVNITIQLFITKNVIIDQRLKQSISPILWNTKMHYDIPVLLQDLENKDEQCKLKKLFDGSIIHLQKHLQICTSSFGFNHPYVAISYNMIGLRYDDKGQYDKAIEFFGKALEIILDIFGINYSFVAQLYYNLGLTYDNKQQYDKSIECHEKALKIRLEVFGTSHEDVAIAYYGLGFTYGKKGDDAKASEFFEKALQIRLKIFGTDHNDVAKSYYALGNTYQNTKEYEKSAECHEKALKIRLERFGVNHRDVADSYNNLGCLYHDKRQYDKAIDCHKKALEIRRQIFGNSSNHVANSLWNLGYIFETIGDTETARKYFEESWKVFNVILGEWHTETLGTKRAVKRLSR
ncbi:hypothetical protein RFI_08162 [Reticulomyxa filosa]|uniref:Uncharacterized protein n=1 Tax=Reticulomyxa filosa TaxID=46433 RepID=X6NSJ6_RETFI|nr:hypothetical protein RFI_08162 [Reticulomyxa filosa]|eukprot:ETO28961.1 hypothetical protein RFI_08162 [Reticulomyxa filosa]